MMNADLSPSQNPLSATIVSNNSKASMLLPKIKYEVSEIKESSKNRIEMKVISSPVYAQQVDQRFASQQPFRDGRVKNKSKAHEALNMNEKTDIERLIFNSVENAKAEIMHKMSGSMQETLLNFKDQFWQEFGSQTLYSQTTTMKLKKMLIAHSKAIT